MARVLKFGAPMVVATAAVLLSVSPAFAQGYSVQGPRDGAQPPPPAQPDPQPAQDPVGAPNAQITNVRGRGLNGGVISRSPNARGPLEYGGIVPNGADVALLQRWARRRANRNRPVIAWPGFQMTANGSRLFFASTQAPTLTPVVEPGRLVYRIERAVVPLANNRRALETAGFDTPIQRAYLRRTRGRVELVIELRANNMQPTLTQQQSEGVTFVLLEFARWTPPETSSATTGQGAGPGRVIESPRTARLPASQGTITPANGQDDERPPPPVVR
ncbi:MAG: hypothetical protein Q8Q09_24765 [Deltaproteobacteria bacterium]|nr:hypothetical protein [Deltaproteobacteria bacterium]